MRAKVVVEIEPAVIASRVEHGDTDHLPVPLFVTVAFEDSLVTVTHQLR